MKKKVIKGLSVFVASTALCAGIATATACSGGSGTYTGSYSYTNGYGATYGMMVEVTVENNIITGIKDITNTDLSKQGGYKKTWDPNVGEKGANVYTKADSGIEWHDVSDGWSKYFMSSPWVLYSAEELAKAGVTTDKDGGTISADDKNSKYYTVTNKETKEVSYAKWDGKTVIPVEQTKGGYGWSDENEKTWTSHVSYLLQKYVGWSVADILDIRVYTDYGYSLAKDSNTTFVPDNTISGEPYETKYNEELASSGLLITGSTQGSGRLILAVQDALKNR